LQQILDPIQEVGSEPLVPVHLHYNSIFNNLLGYDVVSCIRINVLKQPAASIFRVEITSKIQ
jgi:hypothetical protein